MEVYSPIKKIEIISFIGRWKELEIIMLSKKVIFRRSFSSTGM
jgi:hypothetical protein